MARIDRRGNEDRRIGVSGAVLEEQHLAHFEPAERCDDQVQIAVAVEVGGLNVRDPAEASQQRRRAKRTVPVGPGARPRCPIACRLEISLPRFATRMSLIPSRIEVRYLRMGWIGHGFRHHLQLRARFTWLQAKHSAIQHVASNHVELQIVREVGEPDTRNRRRGTMLPARDTLCARTATGNPRLPSFVQSPGARRAHDSCNTGRRWRKTAYPRAVSLAQEIGTHAQPHAAKDLSETTRATDSRGSVRMSARLVPKSPPETGWSRTPQPLAMATQVGLGPSSTPGPSPRKAARDKAASSEGPRVAL